jgi:hypothetical protein
MPQQPPHPKPSQVRAGKPRRFRKLNQRPPLRSRQQKLKSGRGVHTGNLRSKSQRTAYAARSPIAAPAGPCKDRASDGFSAQSDYVP